MKIKQFSKQIANLVDKRLIRIFGCDSLLENSRKLIHTSTELKNEKKMGNFVNLSNFNQSAANRTSKEALKVKLYPGFQESIEDVYSKPTDDQFGKHFSFW
jgi:hypothetical protein